LIEVAQLSRELILNQDPCRLQARYVTASSRVHFKHWMNKFFTDLTKIFSVAQKQRKSKYSVTNQIEVVHPLAGSTWPH
jgi:hypothetical protein